MGIYWNICEFMGILLKNLLRKTHMGIYGNFTKEFVKGIYRNFTKEFVKKNTQKTHIKLIFVCSTKIFSVFRKINFCHVC